MKVKKAGLPLKVASKAALLALGLWPGLAAAFYYNLGAMWRPTCTVSQSFGESNLLNGDDSGDKDFLIAQPAVVAVSGTIQSLNFYVLAASGNLRLGVYDSAGPSGGPGNKVVETAELTPSVGWNTVNVPGSPNIAAGTYWLAFTTNDDNLHSAQNCSAGTMKYYSRTYGALPATFSTSPNSAGCWYSFYVTITTTNTNFGNTVVQTGTDSANSNLLLANSTFIGASRTLQSLSYYVDTPSGKLRLGIYDSTGPSGGPGAKIAETAELIPSAGWNTANVLAPVLLTPGNYWLAFLTNDDGLISRADCSTGSAKYFGVSYGVMPATFSTTPLSSTCKYSLYATLNACQ